MKIQYRLILAGMLLLMPAQTLTVYAGSLNGNEQELLGVISGTETYNGQTYRVKEEYIAQARAYFLQDDVDITDEQKQEALQTMYGSIAQGVAEGYLEPVGGSGTAYEGGSGSGSAQNGGEEAEKGGAEGENGTAESEETEPETTLAPVILVLEQIQETEPKDSIRDFPLEEIRVDYPSGLLATAETAAGVCLAVTAGVAARLGLFHHHHSKKGRRR